MKTTKIEHVRFSNVTQAEVLELICKAVDGQSEGGQIITVNSDIFLQAERDNDLEKIIHDSWLVTPDGAPIIWLSRMMGDSLPERVTGADLVLDICRVSGEHRLRVFFLGGKPGVAELAKQRAEQRWSRTKIVSTYCPSHQEVTDHSSSTAIVDRINKSGANVLLVGLGAPKQEKWIAKYKNKINAPVLIGVGASFDFLAETLPRAPKWMQNLGMEWLFRLFSEPRRLWRRYLSDLKILRIFAQVLLRRMLSRGGP